MIWGQLLWAIFLEPSTSQLKYFILPRLDNHYDLEWQYIVGYLLVYSTWLYSVVNFTAMPSPFSEKPALKHYVE